MTEVVDTPVEAAELEQPPLIVREPLERWLDEHGLGSGPIEAQRIGEGHSNVTYELRRGQQRLVLRRPPRPPFAESAHDVLREARLLETLEPAAVRTPRVLAASDDEEILGVPFYVMEHLDGVVMTSDLPDSLDSTVEHARIASELIDALVELHAVDWREVGLEGFGKPSGYLERQLRRFGGLWEESKTREVEDLDGVTAWLGSNIPESGEATIVHGDYRLGNAMFDREAPARLTAIFDWELSTIGDPLADVGYLTANYATPDDDPEGPMFKLSAATAGEGFPSRDELMALYEERSGRSVSDLRWYQALALWKSAIFFEGSYRRFKSGTTDDPYFESLDEGMPELAAGALAVTRLPPPE